MAEIVRFRLIDGADTDAFLEATRAMQPAVEAAPGYVSRSLSQGEAGVWTDYVVWRDMAAALSAAEEVFKEPVAQTFGAMIETDSIEMRHEPVLWHTE